MLVGVDKISLAFVVLFFLDGWALVSTLVLRGAKSLTRVFAGGFPIGATKDK